MMRAEISASPVNRVNEEEGPASRSAECRPCCSGGGIRTRDLRVMLTNYDFHRRSKGTVCGLDFLFTLGRTVRGLPLSLYTFP